MCRSHVICMSILLAYLPATLAAAGANDSEIEALNAKVKRLEILVQRLRAHESHLSEALEACQVTVAKTQRYADRSERALRECNSDRKQLSEANEIKNKPAGAPLAPSRTAKAITATRNKARPKVATTAPRVTTHQSLKSFPPDPPASMTYQRFDPATGDEKADQVISAMAFPQVPRGKEKGKDWLKAHLDTQYAVLQRLYTENALRALQDDERECRDPRTDLFCKMKNRLHWIESAL